MSGTYRRTRHSSRPQDRVRYLRDCWQADNRAGGVLDVFAAKIEHRCFLTESELLTGSLNPLPVEREIVEPMARAAAVYLRERSLVYGAFLLAGRQRSEESRAAQPLAAPLLLYPAELGEDEDFPHQLMPLRLDLENRRVNFAALTALTGDEEAANEVAEALFQILPEEAFNAKATQQLASRLEELLPGIDAGDLHRFPALAGEATAVEAARKARRSNQVRCLSATVLALVPNSVETRGVLHELAAIAEDESLSIPLGLLLSGDGRPEGSVQPAEPTVGPASRDSAGAAVPAVLSRAQQQALISARRAPLTLIIGPPGTGKSFTLAAIALDHASRGEPVLVTSRSDRALDVLAAKIEQLLGNRALLLRGGRRQHLRELKGAVEDLLHGILPPGAPSGRPLAELHRHLSRTEKSLQKLERQLSRRLDLELQWGERTDRGEAPFWRHWDHRLLGWRIHRQPPPWQLLERYEARLAERGRLLSELLRQQFRNTVVGTLEGHRRELKHFLDALRARQSSRQDTLFDALDLPVLLKTFPLWLVNFSDAHRVLPRMADMFRLVVIDEATQCDMASGLPLIQRGRRLVVTGDPRQLRHVSFLARHRQRTLADRNGLTQSDLELFDFRSKSLLDLASERVTSQHQVVFLDEHFRSAPGIIRFSNREFYRGTLKVMTRRPSTEASRSLRVVHVSGRREPMGHNPVEAEALTEELERWLAREEGLPPGAVHSLGVLSPFREQVEHLREILAKRLSPNAFEKHRLLLGTPFTFQGEERDVMFLSLSIDPFSPSGSFVYLNRPDVFNVAITRARDVQFLFASLRPEDAPAGSLLGRYLAYAQGPPAELATARDLPADSFLTEVRGRLEARGARCWPDWEVAGLRVDLVVERGGRTLGLDLVGHPGAYEEALDLERCRMLLRAGLEVFPLPFSLWQKDPEPCLEAILGRLM